MTPAWPQVSEDLFAFEWARDEAGYKLASEKASAWASDVLLGRPTKKGRVQVIARKGGALKAYPPRAVPDLHRRFAALPDESRAVLGFVNQFGFLGVTGEPVEKIQSEPVTAILECRAELRGVLDYLDSTQSLVQQIDRTAAELREQGESTPGDSGEFMQIAGGLFNQWAARYRKQLELTFVPASDRRGKAVAEMHVRPRTLLASLWLLTAEEITGGVKWRPCAVCGAPMPIGNGGSRRDRRTCSVRCRKILSAEKARKK